MELDITRVVDADADLTIRLPFYEREGRINCFRISYSYSKMISDQNPMIAIVETKLGEDDAVDRLLKYYELRNQSIFYSAVKFIGYYKLPFIRDDAYEPETLLHWLEWQAYLKEV